MTIIGIDVGLDGAVAVLPEGRVFDTPTVTVASGKRVRRKYLPQEMMRLLLPYASDGTLSIVEDVHAMPRQGSASTFSLGTGWGLWIGILAGLGIPYDLVSPARWKREMMDGMGKEKDAARLRAMQLFPALSEQLALKKHHGRAEALLIAEYRRRQG